MSSEVRRAPELSFQAPPPAPCPGPAAATRHLVARTGSVLRGLWGTQASDEDTEGGMRGTKLHPQEETSEREGGARESGGRQAGLRLDRADHPDALPGLDLEKRP